MAINYVARTAIIEQDSLDENRQNHRAELTLGRISYRNIAIRPRIASCNQGLVEVSRWIWNCWV